MFSIKRLAAAVALAAVAGSASAALGTNDLVLVVYDPVTLQTYLRDLGTATFADATGLTSTAGTGDLWSTFFKAADASQIQWSVIGANQGAAANGGAFYSTVQAPFAPVLAQDSALGSTYTSNLTIGFNALTAGGASVLNTVTTAGADWNVIAQAASIGTPSYGGLLGTASIDPTSLSFVKSAVGLRNAITTTQFTTKFTLDTNGGLNVAAAAAAVPEPGTWALMVAGLLTVGAIARRRAI